MAALSLGAAGCAGGHFRPVSPQEIPALEQQLAAHPDDGELLLRYAAALESAGRCDSASAVAQGGMRRRPASPIGPLVVGRCAERAESYDQALNTYRAYLAAHGDHEGADAVRARELLALRARANAEARDAVAREADLAQQPGDPQTVAVLPLTIVGDSSYRPLSRGLAQMLISDLDLLRRFRMVERLNIHALLSELDLAETGRVDRSTAARVGHLLRAGRMVQGLAVIPDGGQTRLEASVVMGDGEATGAASETGRFRDLLRMEKQVVVGLAGRLGYTLSAAERERILENGTQNLAAFLAYSRGLEAEEAGDYAAAAAYFAQAVRADPRFTQARAQYRATAVAPRVQQAPSATEAAAAQPPADITGPPVDVMAAATQNVIQDVASQAAENVVSDPTGGTTGTGVVTNAADPTGTQTQLATPPTATGIIRVLFVLPFIP